MKVTLTQPKGKDWNVNDGVFRPVYNALGDLLCAGKGGKYRVVFGTAWFGVMETTAVEFVDGKSWTPKERLLSCSFFAKVEYDRKMDEWGCELRKES